MSGGARPLRPAEAALSLLLSPPGKAGNDEAQLQLLRRLQEFPESFLPPAQQQQHCRHHPHHHCQEVEGHGTPGGWQETQKLIAALLSLVSSPSTSSSSSPANLELRVHATLALTTLLVLSQPPANDGSGDDGDDDRRAAAAAALAHALSRTASTLLQLVASSQHQQKRQQQQQQQKRGGAERGAVLPAPLRRVALEGLVELETAFPGLLWEEREQLKALAAGTTVGVAALLALVLANGTAAGGGGITRSGGSRTRAPAGDVAVASNGNAASAAANLNAAGVSAGADAGATSRERGTGSTSTATATATTAAAAASAETRASIAAVLDRLPLLSPPRQLLAARRLAAAASASRVPPVVFKPQLLRLMASSEPPLVAAALLMKRAFGDALFAPDEEALLARRLAVVAAHPGAAAADGTRMLASQWLLRFPENSPLHDDDDDGGSGGGRDAVTGCCECDGSVGSNTSGGDGVGPDCSASGGVDGYGGDAGGRDAAVGGDGCGGCCHGIAGGRGGTVRAPLSLAPAIAASLFPTVFQGCPPLFPPSSRSSSREDGASTAYLLLSRFQLLCLIHCEDDFGEAHGESGAGEGADRLLGCLRAMASDLARRSRQRRQQQQNKRQQQKRRQQQRSVPCPFFGAALLYFRHFRQNAPALCGLRQLLLDAFVEDVRLSPRVVRLVDRMQEEEEAAEALAVATALESSSSTSSSTSSLTSASPPPASPRGGGFPVQLLRSLQEAIVGAASGPRSQPLQRPLERLPYELLVLERVAREPQVPAAPALIFLLRLVSPEAGPAAGAPGVLGDWEGGCGVLAVCRHLLARPGGGAADAVAAPLLSRLLLTLAQSPLCDVDVRDRARALAGLQAALSPAKLRALLSAPPAAAAAVARCGRHHRRDHRHNDAAAPVPASPIAEVPCLVPLAEPALALALVDPDRDGGDDVAGADVAGDVNEEDALPVYLRWLRGDKNGGNWGSRPDEAQVGLRVALRDDWSRRHGRVYAVQLNFVGARAEDVRLPYLGPAGNDGTGGRTARLRLSWSRGSRRYRDVTLAPTAVFVDGLGRTCRCRLPTLSVPLASLLQPLAPALSPGARSRLFEELWARFTTTAADAAASDGSQILDCDDDDDVIDPAACAQSVLRLGGGAGSEGAAAGEAARGAAAERLERGLHRFAVSVRDGGRRRDADGDRGPAGRRAFWAAMMLPPGRHILVRVTGARVQKGGSGCGAGGGSGPAAVLVTVATDDWRLLPLIGSHLAKVARVKGEGL